MNWDLINIQYLKDNSQNPEEVAFGMISGMLYGICNTFNQYNGCANSCYSYTVKMEKNKEYQLEEIFEKFIIREHTPTWKILDNNNWKDNFIQHLRVLFYEMSNLGLLFYKQQEEHIEALFCFEKNFESLIFLIDFITQNEGLTIYDFSKENEFPIHLQLLFVNDRNILHFYLDNYD